MLNWGSRFNICSFLDNHQYHSDHHSIECILAAGAVSVYEPPSGQSLPGLDEYLQGRNDWIFGHISYDLKNEIWNLSSAHPDPIGFPDLFFFQPETIVQLSGSEATIRSFTDPQQVYNELITAPVFNEQPNGKLEIRARIGKDQYTGTIEKLRQHIRRGDCYEINFCQEFYAENARVDPTALYQSLTAVSPNPFACFYKQRHRYLLCASPERYLQKKGDLLISQPIKGTIKRDTTNQEADQQLARTLSLSEKDKSENVMVVDLVRNDLSRICREGTVAVSELFSIHSFPQVHQMISTITGRLEEHTGFTEILRATFPMGSMTGAPKKNVLLLTEQYERTRRGIYSGAVGYITPEKDFDFNVVIRSILYNEADHYLSYLVGGGITFYSDAENEYEECLLKATAINKVLQAEN
ncbi:para-aminobenzoate synthetase component 1 [Sediminibacterium ginsengisoli]|uniref:Para-aminobenzoate synthetase component 1 n=2 Tax=Sediminibacterium ginsengisoli TaxID=413434 RepID=A0A1T4JX09_9BACT|nr:para-aminobenzoate synthetase component 1 [Sediminibacterium ginsengisoli]